MCTEAINKLEKRLGKSHPDIARAINTLANLLRVDGRYLEAFELYARVVDIFESRLGTGHAYYAEALNNMANVFYDWKRYGEALPLYERALAIQKKSFGPDHQNVGVTSRNLAVVVEAMGEPEIALPLYEDALRIRSAVLVRTHPELVGLRKAVRKARRLTRRGGRVARVADFVRDGAERVGAGKVAGMLVGGVRKGASILRNTAARGAAEIGSRLKGNRPYSRARRPKAADASSDEDENSFDEDAELK
jgi:tetratricopeptide (TPR) repeat protein